MQIVLRVMLHMMCENYRNDPMCDIQVKGEYLKLIHNTPTLYVQEKARTKTKMIELPRKLTCILKSYSSILNLHTHKSNIGKFSNCL